MKQEPSQKPAIVEHDEITEAETEQKSSLLSHLQALKKVLLISGGAVLFAFFLVFYLAIEDVMQMIILPMKERGIEVVFTAMSEALVTKFKVGLICAVVLASPIIIWQLWGFIKPGLYPKERKVFRILFVFALILFLSGISFCYFAVYNLAIDFFIFSGDNLATPLLSIDKYVSFLFGFIIPFGVAFQLPVVLYLTTRLGWTNARSLGRQRKFVILGIFFCAAILTPPDIVSQIALGLPMYILFEIGVLVSRFTRPRVRE